MAPGKGSPVLTPFEVSGWATGGWRGTGSSKALFMGQQWHGSWRQDATHPVAFVGSCGVLGLHGWFRTEVPAQALPWLLRGPLLGPVSLLGAVHQWGTPCLVPLRGGGELVLGQEQANSPPAGKRVSLNLPKLKVWL